MASNNTYKYRVTFIERQDIVGSRTKIVVYGDSLEQGMFKLVTILGEQRAKNFKIKLVEELNQERPENLEFAYSRTPIDKSPYSGAKQLEQELATLING